ncbi:MAG: NAD(P)-dependent alcohol dehydrogenase [Lewinellaceae bacterium]|nr:NAD(P)-dependent alcohol dehydrogenase [Lewinellaceae bacterium]
MLAAYREKYCLPGGLRVVDSPVPQPKDDEVLVRVYATTVNRTDYALLTGKPLVMHLFAGFLRPKLPVPGTDFAGVIERVGTQVSRFKVGDRVFGFRDMGLGSQAQYMTIAANQPMAIIPEGISFDQAAASLEGAHYAYNFINKLDAKPGQKVLINGATGAIGSAAVQLAKHLGLIVTAVGNTPNLALLKSLGADKVIDHLQEDFTQGDEQYDFVFDAVGKSTFGRCKTVLAPQGVYLSSELGPWGQNLILPLLTALKGGKRVVFPVPGNIPRSITFISELLEKGKFNPVIDRKYPLQQISEAYTYVNSGQKTGNVVLDLGD